MVKTIKMMSRIIPENRIIHINASALSQSKYLLNYPSAAVDVGFNSILS